MKVTENKVVTITYSISDRDGSILESSAKSGNLTYLHYSGSLIPGMEKALSDKKEGDRIDEIIEADDAFGKYDDEMVFSVPRSQFSISDEELKEGLEFQAQISGEMRFCRIEKINGNQIKINANHPLSGKDIRFEAEILEIRDATDEEIEHGHVHGEHEHHSHESGSCCGHHHS
jgi:FKBP-type peptidyl-prolyl cis-trans isomerase SlyD